MNSVYDSTLKGSNILGIGEYMSMQRAYSWRYTVGTVLRKKIYDIFTCFAHKPSYKAAVKFTREREREREKLTAYKSV